MSGRRNCCCPTYSSPGNPKTRRDANNTTTPAVATGGYCRFFKSLTLFVVSVLLTVSVNYAYDKYSVSSSVAAIQEDFKNLRSILLEVSSAIPKMSEAIVTVGNGMSESAKQKSPRVIGDGLSAERVTNLIRRELDTYDADKTGMADYALESYGAKILSTRNTETYSPGAPAQTFFGIPICQPKNSPRSVIQPGALPGECWTFAGTSGAVVIQLMGNVYITGFSLEHIPSSISPTGETSSAPRNFSLWGLQSVDDSDPFLFGEFTYDNKDRPMQYFQVQTEPNRAYEIVELKIHSNSGNQEYTCVYRLRVHGRLTQ